MGAWWNGAMNFALGLLAWLAGCVMMAMSFQQLSKANPGEEISPVLGRPTHYPGLIHVYKIMAAVFMLLSFYAWADVLGGYAAVGFFIAWVPVAVLNHQHNRRIPRRPLGQ